MLFMGLAIQNPGTTPLRLTITEEPCLLTAFPLALTSVQIAQCLTGSTNA